MGFNLTPQKKLISVNQSLGNLAITQQQATSREVYDTESYTATQTFFTFFETFAAKDIFQTNLTSNKLDSQESMVINEIIISQERNNVPANLTNILAGATKLNVYVGNQRVIKDFNTMFLQSASFNFFPTARVSGGGFTISMPCLTSIVIPPQVGIKVTMETEQDGGVASGVGNGLKFCMKGYGTLFNPSTSL